MKNVKQADLTKNSGLKIVQYLRDGIEETMRNASCFFKIKIKIPCK